MQFQTDLISGTLIIRYKRFLADIRLDTGEVVTAHCANPGAMLGLTQPGLRVWLERNDDPKRKLRYAWRLAELPGGHWVGIDTSLPNRVIKQALLARAVPPLSAYGTVRPEVRYGSQSRVDFLLSEQGLPACYVEVKNVHLRRNSDWAEFPDCVTKRGARHLAELTQMVRDGHRAVMLYLVQRTDCTRLRMAGDLDPAYARAFDAARAAGVEMLCHGTAINPKGVEFGRSLPVDPAPQSPPTLV